jgi:hypothetical protein
VVLVVLLSLVALVGGCLGPAMITPVLDRGPARHESASAQLRAARAEALFTSDLSARREYTEIEVAAAIRRAIGTHNGIRGCVAEVAAAYGDHPETAAGRMRWARAVIEAIDAPAGSSGNHGGAAPGGARGVSLAERGYIRASFGGMPVLVGPELAAQLQAVGQSSRGSGECPIAVGGRAGARAGGHR